MYIMSSKFSSNQWYLENVEISIQLFIPNTLQRTFSICLYYKEHTTIETAIITGGKYFKLG